MIDGVRDSSVIDSAEEGKDGFTSQLDMKQASQARAMRLECREVSKTQLSEHRDRQLEQVLAARRQREQWSSKPSFRKFFG